MAKVSSDKVPVILLFTDIGSTRVFLKKTLHEDYYILEVDSPKELLDKVKTTKLEVIIIDDKLKIDLSFLLKQIRTLPNTKHLPILVITSNLKRSYMKELLTAGATEFLREPLEDTEVLVRIVTATQLQSVHQKLGPIAQSLSQQLPTLAGKKLSGSRVSIHDQALKEINKAIQNKQSISLLMVDIDHLEKVKTRWGEPALLELLDSIEKHFNSLLRTQDVLINPTQDRYIVVLPKTSETAAKILAANIEDSFKISKFTTQKGTVRLPISIAVVTLSEKDMHLTDAYQYLEKMLSTGEANLEKAKKIGKRIVSS